MTKQPTLVQDEAHTRPERLWTVEETAAFLRVDVGTLYQWRHRRKGPVAAKPGKHLLNDPADVYDWFRGQVA
jgi:hypothetical protein